MWQDIPGTTALTIAHTIQLAVAPVFLLSGVAAMLNVFAGRLARAVDRSRVIEGRFLDLAADERRRAVIELKTLDRRMRLISASIALGTLSAVSVCLVVAGLFVSRLIGGGFGRTVAVLFILAMTLLVAALALFLIEVFFANASIRVRHDLLESGVDNAGR